MNFRYNKKVLNIVIAILICSFGYSQSGDTSIKKIRYIYDSTGNFVDKLTFHDSITGEQINSFDIRQNNPFNGLPYPKFNTRFLSYDVKGVKLNELSEKIKNLNIVSGITDDFELLGSAYIFSGVYESNNNYSVITYHFNVGNIEDVIAYCSVIYVFNNRGEIIKTVDDISSPVGDRVLTPDGRFLAVAYLGNYNTDYEIISDQGCMIYNLENDSVINMVTPKKYNGFTAPVIAGTKLVIKCRNAKEINYSIMDFEKNIKYTKSYSKSLIKNGLLKKITDEGFVFEKGEKGSGIYKTDKYEEDFSKFPIQ